MRSTKLLSRLVRMLAIHHSPKRLRTRGKMLQVQIQTRQTVGDINRAHVGFALRRCSPPSRPKAQPHSFSVKNHEYDISQRIPNLED